MELRQVSRGCEGGDCPTVYLTDRGTVVFQGDTLSEAHRPSHAPAEGAVELPLDVVRSALPALSDGA